MSDFHWPPFFQRSTDALFVLNRQRRLLWVNSAWEQLTGMDRAAARGLACRVRRAPPPEDALDLWLARTLAPPPEVCSGQPGRVRRMIHLGDVSHRWDVDFFPFRDEAGVLGILGRITPLPADDANRRSPLVEALANLAARVRDQHGMASLGEAASVQRLLAQVRLATQTRLPVTIHGEAGCGKEWIARVIHSQSAVRGPFAALDCRRLPPVALAAALFEGGRLVRRAGTLFLREPGCLPRDFQAVLSTWLTAAGFEAPRVLVGCRTLPDEDVRAGRLTEELAAALTVLVVEVPPLRQRLGDLVGLIERMLERFGGGVVLSREALAVLTGHRWPGNLRELENVLTEARKHAIDGRIEVRHLPMYLRMGREPALESRSLRLDDLLEKVERQLIVLALQQSKGKAVDAARLLGILPPRLFRRIKALKILKRWDVSDEDAADE